MNKKILGIIIATLLIVTIVLPAMGSMDLYENKMSKFVKDNTVNGKIESNTINIQNNKPDNLKTYPTMFWDLWDENWIKM